MRVRSWALSRKRDGGGSPARAGGNATREVIGCLITVPPLEANAGHTGRRSRRSELGASIGRLNLHVNGNFLGCFTAASRAGSSQPIWDIMRPG
jgi:hypothetical protein